MATSDQDGGTVRLDAEVPPQPAADSYTSAELVGWLLHHTVSKGERAAVELLANHGQWLERTDWRARCVTIFGDGPGRSALINWDAWYGALEEYRRREESADAEGMPAGLHHGKSSFTIAHLAGFLARDPFRIRGLDVLNTRHVVGAMMTAAGHPAAVVLGDPLGMLLVRAGVRDVPGTLWPVDPVPVVDGYVVATPPAEGDGEAGGTVRE